MPETLRVAILGGGIAGCTLANGLLRHSHVSFDIYDAKSTFGERGAGVALAPNAIKALDTLGLNTEAILKDAGALKMDSTYCIVGLGPHIGKPILELPGGVHIVTRSLWLETLIKSLPKDRLHSNKTLTSIDSPNPTGPYTLNFEDGSSAVADTVIGCDGVRSKMREIVLQDLYPNKIAPVFGGYWDARGRMTPKDAAEQFGTELFNPLLPNEVALVGDGSLLLFAPSDDGAVYHVTISAIAGTGYDTLSWRSELTKEFLEKSYQHWDEKYRNAIIKCLLDENSAPGVVFSQWESQEAPTYHKNGLCMIGDAAHATIPWLGQGACMAIEDAAVVSALIGNAQTPHELLAAITAFDKTRRGRPEYVVKQSREAAKLLTGAMGLDPAKVAHLDAPNWWRQVWKINMEEHIAEAIDAFNELKKSE